MSGSVRRFDGRPMDLGLLAQEDVDMNEAGAVALDLQVCRIEVVERSL